MHKQEASKLNNTVVLEPSPNLSPKMATLFGDGAKGIANSRRSKAANITLMTFTPFKHAFGQCRDARGLKMKKGGNGDPLNQSPSPGRLCEKLDQVFSTNSR